MMTQDKKYRSKVRDQPRVIRSRLSLPGRVKQLSPSDTETGDLTYRRRGPRFGEIFRQAEKRNEEKLRNKYSHEIQAIAETIDLQYELASHFFWLFDSVAAADISPVNDILYPCFHKSLINLQSAYYLSCRGLYGSARPLLRHAFESLVIAKFCSVDQESEVFDKWVDGLEVYFSNAVLKRIVKPDPIEFRKLWGLMSNYTHSSVYAVQPDFNLDDAFDDVEFNFVLIEIMLECQFHLLVSHIITPSMGYYQSRYAEGERAREIKKKLGNAYSAFRQHMTSTSKRFIRDFKATWNIRP